MAVISSDEHICLSFIQKGQNYHDARSRLQSFQSNNYLRCPIAKNILVVRSLWMRCWGQLTSLEKVPSSLKNMPWKVQWIFISHAAGWPGRQSCQRLGEIAAKFLQSDRPPSLQAVVSLLFQLRRSHKEKRQIVREAGANARPSRKLQERVPLLDSWAEEYTIYKVSPCTPVPV